MDLTNLTPDELALYNLLSSDGTALGNGKARESLGWDEARYQTAKEGLLKTGEVAAGRGRGGSLYRIVESDLELTAPPSTPTAVPKERKTKTTSAATPNSGDPSILSYRHDQKRKNNPEVGMVDPETDPDEPKTNWKYDPHLDPALQFDSSATRARVERLIDEALASKDASIMRMALEELRRLQSPYLQWTGKAERTSFEVDTVSLHVHERIDPASILSAVRKQMEDEKQGKATQGNLFAAPFEQLPLRDAIDFYKHDKGWSNRLVLGDSLLVMNSLLQKESMAGQVQMIYVDPPYGIKYGSNFQPFVDKRDVKDRSDEDLTQEPEMIRAFRDTWELGIHSYLTYLRDRLLLAKDLLHESGSIFIQISDENIHLVRNLCDELFGPESFVGQIQFKKTGGFETTSIASICDYLLWYAKDKAQVKYRPLFDVKNWGVGSGARYKSVQLINGDVTPLSNYIDDKDELNLPDGARLFLGSPMTSDGASSDPESFMFNGRELNHKANQHWKTGKVGRTRLAKAGRLLETKSFINFRLMLNDFPAVPLTNMWTDTMGTAERDKAYVVQTTEKILERVILMTTDPSDIVLDITCGSGTTATVAEEWGRRWITCDTSRVAVTLAKQRLMTASFDYYSLKYPQEGLRGGFVYKSVPHVKLGGIANNNEIDTIYERLHPPIQSVLSDLNVALAKSPPKPFKVTEGGRRDRSIDFSKKGSEILPSGEEAPVGALLEWEVPFDFPEDWTPSAKEHFDAFHAARIAMQREMDRSIASYADQVTLYDQPEVDRKKLRITGPFSVEAVPTPTVLTLDEAQQPAEADASIARTGESARQHQWRDELLKTGIRGKGGQMIRFAELETLPGTTHLHCSGTLADNGARVVVCFGPAHAALEQRTVAHAINEASTLVPKPKFIVFAAFVFDPEAAKDIDETNWPGVTLLKAQMNTDLLTEDLKKSRSSNQSFWLMGQPDVELRKRTDGTYEVEVRGFDYFDTAKGELVSGGTKKVALWLLDTDYDDRSLYPRQVFFPMAGDKDGWFKLKKTIRTELNEDLLEAYHGTVSLPFDAGTNRKIAVKVVDDRGIESLRIIKIEA